MEQRLKKNDDLFFGAISTETLYYLMSHLSLYCKGADPGSCESKPRKP